MSTPPKKNNPQTEADKTEVADSESNTLKIHLEEAKKTSPALVVISGKPLGKSFFINKDNMILGRDLKADISVGESSISREHVRFVTEDLNVSIEDLGSTNGTQVNDHTISHLTELEDGDLIRVGNTIFKFLSQGQIENVHYKKMYDLATRDDLTQTLNKKALIDKTEEEFQRCHNKKAPLSFLMFDIDHFKKINDQYGHPAGDYALKTICDIIMNKMIRQEDTLGRYGGEEFCLILPETPLQIAVDIAERIRKTIEGQSFDFDEHHFQITLSLGAVAMDSTTSNAEDMIKLADAALYDAKNQGRNRVCVR